MFLYHHTGRVFPIKLEVFKPLEYLLDCLLASQQIKGVGILEATEKPPIQGQEWQEWFLLSKGFMWRYTVYIIYITQRLTWFCFFSDSSSRSPVPLSKDSNPFVLRQKNVVFCARDGSDFSVHGSFFNVFLFLGETPGIPTKMRLMKACEFASTQKVYDKIHHDSVEFFKSKRVPICPKNVLLPLVRGMSTKNWLVQKSLQGSSCFRDQNLFSPMKFRL